ncbi:hypothetical protein R3P38DRAFT_3137259 [Favolaschia claudopus]|uniref:Uncharacterized protein n=1 Tax=Favolaschia claudopus TaxID=2862362 RepID=A0AAV9Z6P5_9AGAR
MPPSPSHAVRNSPRSLASLCFQFQQDRVPARVLGALATRFNLGNQKNVLTDLILKDAIYFEWSKIRRIDSEAGDTMTACGSTSKALANQQNLKDRTFVQFEMYVDIHARRQNRASVFELRTFYGQLQHTYLVNLQNTLDIPADYSIILVEIKTCQLTGSDERLDLHFYSHLRETADVVDATALQCVVGRVPDKLSRDQGIVDRSGNLARALYLDNLGENE